MWGSWSYSWLITPSGKSCLSVTGDPVTLDLTRDQVGASLMQSSSSKCVPLGAKHFIPRNTLFSTRIWPNQELLGFLELRFQGSQWLCYLFKGKDSCVMFAKVFRDRAWKSPTEKKPCSEIATKAESRKRRVYVAQQCPGWFAGDRAPWLGTHRLRSDGGKVEHPSSLSLRVSLLFKEMDTTCYWHFISNELFKIPLSPFHIPVMQLISPKET